MLCRPFWGITPEIVLASDQHGFIGLLSAFGFMAEFTYWPLCIW